MARRRWAGWTALLLVGAVALGACDDEPAKRSGRTKETNLTLGVFGPPGLVAGFQDIVDRYNAQASVTHVVLASWPDRAAMKADVLDGGQVPDIFMVDSRDLATVEAGELNQPLFDLLNDRGVTFGDRFNGPAMAAFSDHNDTQCMPFGIEPTVMYVNTDLVDFDAMAARGLDVAEQPYELWTIDQLDAAATYAVKQHDGAAGLYIEPTLDGLAPFVYTAGGSVYNDVEQPTSLTLSDNNQEALASVLPVLRNPQLTLSASRLKAQPALTWFKRGKLAFLEGTRDELPALRGAKGLHFDVLPLPALDDAPATVARITGLCLSGAGTPKRIQSRADFLTFAISDQSFTAVTETGYIVPASSEVARSKAFLEPDSAPKHAGVYNASLDVWRPDPLVLDKDALDAVVDPLIAQLVTDPTTSIDLLADQIDQESRTVLDPAYAESGSPSVNPGDPGDSGD